jgi:hypothetical protein
VNIAGVLIIIIIIIIIIRIVVIIITIIIIIIIKTPAILMVRRPGDRIPVGARFFATVQTGPGPHPASYKMGTGSFPGGKAAVAWS